MILSLLVGMTQQKLLLILYFKSRVPVSIKISPLIDALPLHLRQQTIHRLGVLLPILQLYGIANILSYSNPARLSQIMGFKTATVRLIPRISSVLIMLKLLLKRLNILESYP